jgi:hypothetical protein
MYRRKTDGRTRKILFGVAAAALVAGGFAISTGVSGASENCTGLNQSMRETLAFMADQRAHPTTQTPAILANRQAVVDLLNVQLKDARCGAVAAPKPPAATKPAKPAAPAAPAKTTPAKTTPAKTTPAKTTPAKPAPATTAPATGAGSADVVCKGSTVTLSGEAGSAAASSGTFPVGTTLKVTNLDNNKSITVKVTGASGSCVLLNNAAFEQVREAGKFLIRRAVIERVG